MKFKILLLLFSIIASSQEKPLQIKIDSINTIDSINQRKFSISYHLENLCNKEISFVLNPTLFVPSKTASMSKGVAYKLFENGNFIDVDDIFVNKAMILFENEIKNAKTKEEKELILKKFYKEKLKLNLD